MPKSLAQLNAQIAKLQKAAEALRAKEVVAVVAKIRALMTEHGLSANDLGLSPGAAKPAKAAKAPKAPRAAKVSTVKRAAKQVAKPAAKASGKSKPAAKAAKAPEAAARAAKRTKKPVAAGVIKYRDEAGNTWTGRGKRPQWYLNALASGKTAEQLLVA